MADATTGAGARPRGRMSVFLFLVWTTAVVSGVGAVALAFWGWWLRDPPAVWHDYLDIGIRSLKALLLSDIYYQPPEGPPEPGWRLEIARALGVVFSLLLATRLLIFALGRRTADLLFRANVKKHDIILGDGPAAMEYAKAHHDMFGGQVPAIRLDTEWAPIVGRMATLQRLGGLPAQMRAAVGKRARRVLVDEGDDSDTWSTAHEIAKLCPDAEITAHITDPWMLDRLSRWDPKFGLTPFSYATGAARQVMLAHPPYLFARRFKAPAQHILVIGFGQVGQAVAREFLVTSVHPEPEPMKVTVVDPQARARKLDFEGRHPELATLVDFAFLDGDFRDNDPALFEKLKERARRAEFCAVYVAVDDEHAPLSLAFAIRTTALQQELFRAPIFVCAQHGAGLAQVKQGIGLVGIETDHEERFQAESRAMHGGMLCDLRVVSFGAWEKAFDGSGLMEPELDGQARRFHETYEKLVARQAMTADPPRDPPAPNPWAFLTDTLRLSNRRAAAHIRAKAHVAGFDLNKWLEQEPRRSHQLPNAGDKFRSDDRAMTVKLAELEHRRWMLDRLLDGWRKGPRDKPRDRYMKIHPDLVPFSELSDSAKAKDENVVQLTAQMLGAPPLPEPKPKKDG